MRIGMQLDHRGGFLESVAELRDLEKAGLGIVFVSELYSFDAVSQLGYIAAATDRLEIASGILQIYTRTPTLTAMTAAGLDYVSGGRFTLGLGVSGPQVIEGFHGVPYEAPLARTREVVEICRKVWRRETLEHQGKYYRIPLGPEQGTGLGKPLKLVNRPVRERIPVMIAATGPKNTALAAEIAEAWEPIFFYPERAKEVFGAALDEGRARRDPALGELGIHVDAPAAIGTDVADALGAARLRLAHYVGGMGARGRNFYFDLACRYGFAAEAARVQDLYLDGRRRDAAAAVPEALVRGVSLIGTPSEVAERVSAFAAAGVTTLSLSPMGRGADSREGRLRLLEQVAALAG
ncbi:probable F420-dependent oxidoreductase, Rv3520c family [Streptomyces sp. DvalAA-14]|uniref:LLM class F420-dependent oxidoreductase n=1 Tax=unclassified Streptomyces TaxID=2593676 RepID=UPI00081B1E9A|nr:MULTISPECIES: LLM class F420-dependent oxidoreductase [unclassified Streptomyces]MYS24416.1 LLM class F420-dependent oxidoreductase [Streptomyces sp. SID4948]SCE45825.1 probable F420-dependent oxidoreductase, Rv3520c family [Streptomyces sp. DvalAA-14]